MENVKPQIRIAPQDVVLREAQTKSKRLDQKTKMNLENMLKMNLRKFGAIGIKAENFDTKEKEAKVKASYFFKNGMKSGEFIFTKDKLGNWNIRNFEDSIDNSETVITQKIESKDEVLDNSIVFDMSLFKAIQHGNAYRIEYPLLGFLAEMKKEEITEKNMVLICSLAASDMSLEPTFTGKFNVEFHDESYVVDFPTYKEINSSDPNIQAKNQITFSQMKNREEMFGGIRENFNTIIKIHAANLVKQLTSNFKNLTKILDVKSFVEFKDGIYSGNVIVKAKVGDLENTYALPIEKGKIKVVEAIDKYKITSEQFKDIVKQELDSRLKEELEADLEYAVLGLEFDKNETAKHLKVESNIQARLSQSTQKTLEVSKVNMEGTEIGDIVNLSGVKYRVGEGSNSSFYVLTLVEDTGK